MARTKMTNAEKAEVTAVREYLKALEQNAPRRGRKRTPDGIRRAPPRTAFDSYCRSVLGPLVADLLRYLLDRPRGRASGRPRNQATLPR